MRAAAGKARGGPNKGRAERHPQPDAAQVLGDYYARDSRNVFRAMWEDYESCAVVVPDKAGEMVYWYTS